VPDKSVYSWPHIGISIIGGVAAALVFAVVARGGLGGLLIGHAAPLPIMIVALGFGLGHGATAAILATVILSVWPHPAVGMSYALVIAIPAWLAAYAASGAPRNRRDLLTKNLPGWAALAPAAVLANVVVVWLIVATLMLGGLDEVLSGVRGRLFLVFDAAIKAREASGDLDAGTLSGQAANAMPGFFAAYLALIQVLNLWIAARLAQASGLLTRPWPDIAREFALPRAVAVLFVIGVGLSFLDGLAHSAGLALTLTFGLLLACEGLAVVHDRLRGSKSSVLVLSILYFFLGLMGWPLVPLAVLGAADTFFNYRDRKKLQAETGE
jgi:hypothetical protein